MLLMVILQLVRADYQHNMVQVLAKITLPVIRPVQRLIPSGARFNTAAFVLAVLLFIAAVTAVIIQLSGLILPLPIVIGSARLLLSTILDICTASLVIHALMSWFGPSSYHSPTGRLLAAINEPLVSPIRNLIGARLGGLDFSYLIVILLISGIRALLDLTFLAGFNLQALAAQSILLVASSPIAG